MKSKQPSKGFVVVASKKPAFYYSALNLIESLLDYMPDARVTLFTEDRFKDERAEELCEHVLPCGDHLREKMYGILNTPYDHTFYIDADCEIQHEDISKVFDFLPGNDMVFVKLMDDPVSKASFVEKDFKGPDGNETLQLCGGVCLYDMTNPLVRDFMQDWNDIFRKQEDEGWVPEGYPKSICRWDQFTLWWLTHKVDKYKDINIGEFDDNYRWNWFTNFRWHQDGPNKGKHRLVDDHPIVVHYSNAMNKEAVH